MPQNQNNLDWERAHREAREERFAEFRRELRELGPAARREGAAAEELEHRARQLTFISAVGNIVDTYIQNHLPMYLVHLSQMKVVDRSTVRQHIQSRMEDMVSEYTDTDPAERETKVMGMVKAATSYVILSHRWLDNGELKFEHMSKIAEINDTGLDKLIKSRKGLKGKQLGSIALLDKAKKLSETTSSDDSSSDDDPRGDSVLNRMKELCETIKEPDEKRSAGSLIKLVEFCFLARSTGCEYAWLDTCCIDKTKSAELEESIRSMYNWYHNSKMCIAQLGQTKDLDDIHLDVWFTRGWTLQELLAPKTIKFFNKDWKAMTDQNNDKADSSSPLMKRISDITGISADQLRDFKPGTKNIRQTMVWASKRQTTRIEDMAYCLIGIFDISLSIGYGERWRAFYRLQTKLMKMSNDTGLFVWVGQPSPYNSMIAHEPKCFDLGNDRGLVSTQRSPGFTMTNRGLRIPMSLYKVTKVRKRVSRPGHSLKVEGSGAVRVVVMTTPEEGLTGSRYSIACCGFTPSQGAPWFILLQATEDDEDLSGYRRVITKEITVESPRGWKLQNWNPLEDVYIR